MKRYLHINIVNMSPNSQFYFLKQFKVLPLKLRFFQNLVFFTFNLLKENRVSVLINSILTLKKEGSLRSSVFREPKCFTQLYKLSFISVAIKLLNSFIFSNLWLTDMSFRSMFNGNDSILFFYIRCSKLWT